MIYEELLEHLDGGTLQFCPPPADAYFEPAVVQSFVSRVLGVSWKDCGVTAETRLTDFVEPDEFDAMEQRIFQIYGVQCSNIPEQNLWMCLKRCEAAAEAQSAANSEQRMSD